MKANETDWVHEELIRLAMLGLEVPERYTRGVFIIKKGVLLPPLFIRALNNLAVAFQFTSDYNFMKPECSVYSMKINGIEIELLPLSFFVGIPS